MEQEMILLYDFFLEEEEICQLARISRDEFLLWQEIGLIEPEIKEGKARFSAENLARLVKARKIQRDFELDFAGTSLVLELLEEIAFLRQRLKRYEND